MKKRIQNNIDISTYKLKQKRKRVLLYPLIKTAHCTIVHVLTFTALGVIKPHVTMHQKRLVNKIARMQFIGKLKRSFHKRHFVPLLHQRWAHPCTGPDCSRSSLSPQNQGQPKPQRDGLIVQKPLFSFHRSPLGHKRGRLFGPRNLNNLVVHWIII